MSMNRQDTLMESEKHNSSGIAERADLRTGPGKGKYDESKKRSANRIKCVTRVMSRKVHMQNGNYWTT